MTSRAQESSCFNSCQVDATSKTGLVQRDEVIDSLLAKLDIASMGCCWALVAEGQKTNSLPEVSSIEKASKGPAFLREVLMLL